MKDTGIFFSIKLFIDFIINEKKKITRTIKSTLKCATHSRNNF